MVYVICEGEDGKAEHLFISAVVDYYSNGKDYTIICACGKENIDTKLSEQLLKIKQGDKIALFFDNINQFNNRSVWSILTKYSTAFSRMGALFYYTTYYCFEEIFLSYNGILDIISQNSVIQKEIKDIQNIILNSNKDYTAVKNVFKNIGFWQGLFSNFGSPTTREQFSSSLIHHLLEHENDSFGVSKNRIGNCWINNCDTLEEKIWFKCRNCKYRCGHKLFAEKLKRYRK